jgi:electron transfer flavoprotein beta subunit
VKIVVLVKQVPATDKVKMDEETGTMIRDGVEAEFNPLDLYAVEEAIRIKENLGNKAEISVMSMGPRMAVDAIKNAIAMGCDKGYLLSDRKFSGADTWATGYTLSIAIKKMLAEFDLILCGERATDGDTGQVGPGVGAHLGIPVLTYVSKIDEITKEKVVVHRAIEGGYEVLEAPTPILVSVIKEINEPRIPTLTGKIKAKKTEIPVLTAEDIGVDEDRLGLKGSLTKVVKTFHPSVTRKGEVFSISNNVDEAVDVLINFLGKIKIIEED